MAHGSEVQTMRPHGLLIQNSNAAARIRRGFKRCVLCLATLALATTSTCAQSLDQMSLDRWKKLREVERYQLNIAERYYQEKKWKVAAAEYEKYLTLYERSEGAAYAQLKWSLCQVNLRKLNTGIKEGFQSVIDYWPDSSEAVAAGYYIGKTYKDMGEIRQAKRALQRVMRDKPQHLAAVNAATQLIDITTIEKDLKTRVSLWKRLTFSTKREKYSKSLCQTASRQLAVHYFQQAAFNDGLKSLSTTYGPTAIAYQVQNHVRTPISQLTADQDSRAKGEKLADQVVSYLMQNAPDKGATPEEQQAAITHWYYMADVQIASRRDDKVLQTYQQITKRFGPTDSTLSRMADWYKSQNMYDKARQQYAKFKDAIEGQNQIANSFRQQNKYELAIPVYQRLQARDAEHALKWVAAVASSYRDAKKYPEAITVYQQLLAKDQEQPERWRWLIATAYRDAGQYKQAIGHFRQCTNFPSNYNEMAACHRALKEYGEAVVLYNQVMGGAPKSAPWALLQIGYTREQAGKKELAIQAFQQVCKKFPKDSHASRAHAHLQTKYKITVTLGGAKDE